MKSAVIYYSYSGNTKKVAQVLAGALKEKGEVDLIEIKALDESKNFFAQAARAFKHVKAKIAAANFNLSSYDLLCFGTPVWAFGPAPAMNAYMESCFGLENKQATLFATYGSGSGKKRCLDYMENILAKRGVASLKRFSIQQFKVKDKEFVMQEIARL